jgi:PKD domain
LGGFEMFNSIQLSCCKLNESNAMKRIFIALILSLSFEIIVGQCDPGSIDFPCALPFVANLTNDGNQAFCYGPGSFISLYNSSTGVADFVEIHWPAEAIGGPAIEGINGNDTSVHTRTVNIPGTCWNQLQLTVCFYFYQMCSGSLKVIGFTTYTFIAYEAPICQFLADDVCLGHPVALMLDCNNPFATYSVDWGDGTPSTTTFSHLYSNAGTYLITLNISHNLCGSISCSQSVTVNPISTINFTGSNTVCPGASAAIIASSNPSALSSILWSTGSSSFSVNLFQGSYTAVGTDINGCQTNPANITINEIQLPVLNISSAGALCPGGNLNLTSTISANWTGPLGFSANSVSSVNVNTPGNYSASVVSGGCTVSDNLTVSLATLPSLPIITNICQGSSATLSISGNNLSWSNGATSSSIKWYYK